jgi:PhoPQ-activated pathogenicity-related protein
VTATPLTFLELVSQCRRNESEVERPRWQHQLTLVVPDEIANDTALLVIAGGPRPGMNR